jgi:hypothetical protein
MELYSSAQAPGLSSLSLDLIEDQQYTHFVPCFFVVILPFCGLKKSLILKLHSSPGELVKKLMGAQKNTTWKIILLLLLLLFHHSMGGFYKQQLLYESKNLHFCDLQLKNPIANSLKFQGFQTLKFVITSQLKSIHKHLTLTYISGKLTENFFPEIHVTDH